MNHRTIKLTKNVDVTTEEFDDGRSYNAGAVRQITQAWVDDHMKEREVQFTESIQASIFCGTWNVNAKKLEGDLDDWLLPKEQTVPSDVYAIGFQEIVDLNAFNVGLDSSKTVQRSAFWQDKIENTLKTTGNRYVLIHEKHLVGLMLCIFVKESIYRYIKDVRSSSTGVGIGGFLGNKGGVSIRMTIYDSSVCFICAHLAAHRDNIAGRNSDYKNISERTLFLVEGENNSARSNSSVDLDSMGNDQVVRPRHGAAQTKGIENK
jgi:phosphatidylinositol-bisphosphatase